MASNDFDVDPVSRLVFDFLAGGKARVGSDGQLRTPHKGRRQKGKNQAFGASFSFRPFSLGRAREKGLGSRAKRLVRGLGGMNPLE